MQNTIWLFYFLGFSLLSVAWAAKGGLSDKPNAFKIIRFANSHCESSGIRNGTCYTETECKMRNGFASGSCASGYGVCCVFVGGCGAKTSENMTYFEVTDPSVGACKYTVCPATKNICQLRLDFDVFSIAGPSTDTTPVVTIQFGQQAVSTVGVPASLGTRCMRDRFTVTNPSGTSPPTICGFNSQQHMYVGSSEECNMLFFTISGEMAAAQQRIWSIKVTQLGCDSVNLPPLGCTQFYYGSVSGVVQSYNFDGGSHLADQTQTICVRRERGICRICWTTSNPTDFAVSGASKMGIDNQESCCRYGRDGLATGGYDCLAIYGAESATFGAPLKARVCGRSEGLVGKFGSSTTICSTKLPFLVTFNSDSYEFADNAAIAAIAREASSPDQGFRIHYFQDSTNC